MPYHQMLARIHRAWLINDDQCLRQVLLTTYPTTDQLHPSHNQTRMPMHNQIHRSTQFPVPIRTQTSHQALKQWGSTPHEQPSSFAIIPMPLHYQALNSTLTLRALRSGRPPASITPKPFPSPDPCFPMLHPHPTTHATTSTLPPTYSVESVHQVYPAVPCLEVHRLHLTDP